MSPNKKAIGLQVIANIQKNQHEVSNLFELNKNFLENKTIHQLFEEQVKKTPYNIAITYGNKQLTYQELNQKANQLAHYLKDNYQIKPDDLIALCLDRSEYIIIAILAALKAGGAYVPIDPSYPDERINYILSDTKAKVILTNTIHQAIFTQKNTLTIDNIIKDVFVNQHDTNPTCLVTSSNLAYVIYTSGTTGKPKGVMVEHKGVINVYFSLTNIYKITPEERILLFSNYAFDASVEQIILAILNGACLFIVSESVLQNQTLFNDYLKNNKISHLNVTPSFISAQNIDNTEFLKRIIVGGEALTNNLLNNLCSRFPLVINAFGHTETTITSLISFNSSTIGKPLTNINIHILNSSLNPVSTGKIGELYVSGAGLARGYLNQPELTKERFIANPFQTKKEQQKNINTRLYKTGDLVKMLSDGNLEYIGRNDFQVKIRGYRIELNEIENVLNKYPGIRQSVVVVTNNKNKNNNFNNSKYLVSYYVSDTKLNKNEILNYLKQQLPEYMLPTVLVHLIKLPLNINGKLDRKALPNPKLQDKIKYKIPKTTLEAQVRKVFANVLGLKENQVGIKDNFYHLGGNSLLAIRLVNQLNNELQIKIDLITIIKCKNISNLVKNVENKNNNPNITSMPVITPYSNLPKEEYKLSFAQERLWFIDKYAEGKSNFYNTSLVYKLSNYCNKSFLFSSIRGVINRHEILRTIIKNGNNSPYQEVKCIDSATFTIVEKHLQSKTGLNESIQQDVNNSFNLSSDLPIRAIYYTCNNTSYLNIVIHHIATDGWSTDIFLRDLIAYYVYHENIEKLNKEHDVQDNKNKLKIDLPELPIQYKDFALWQRKYLTQDILDKQLTYWMNKLIGYETLNLPSDKPRPLHISHTGKTLNFNLSTELSVKLRQTARELNVSLYSLLLSGFYLLMRAYSYQDDVTIGTIASNRHYLQVENLIGFFVNALILRKQINSKVNIKTYIKQVNYDVMEAQLNQDLPFEKLVEEMVTIHDTSRHPIFQIMFVVQHFGQNYQKLFTSYSVKNINQTSKFDLTWMIDDRLERLSVAIEYATSLFEEHTIQSHFETYQVILEQLSQVNEDDMLKKRIKDIKYLNQLTYEKLIVDYNNVNKEFLNNKTIHQLFEEQVKKTPNNIAVIFEKIQLTYRELNQKANQLAHYLIESYQIKPDDLIVLCLDRSENVLIAILAVLKAGGAYVPVDPNYPVEQIKFILHDVKAKILLTNEASRKKIYNLKQSKLVSLFIDSHNFIGRHGYHLNNPNQKTKSTNLAYVMYTSGTAGKPKGVMIEHISCVLRTYNMKFVSNTCENDKILFKTNYMFDVSFSDIFVTLTAGACLLVTRNIFDLDEINSIMQRHSINVSHFTPSQFNLLKNIHGTGFFKNFKTIHFSGEPLEQKLLLGLNKNINCINYYGPTETGEVTYSSFQSDKLEMNKILIGNVLNGCRPFIINDDFQLLPIGALGELYIGGCCIARGYLNQAKLTNKKFVANLFQTEKEKQHNIDTKLYSTGDLVRMLPDGSLEYIGRNDFQVKIRGYRIEINEIENVLNNYLGIKQSTVAVIESKDKNLNVLNDKYLVGYYVSPIKLNEEEIHYYLKQLLPEYMLPSVLVHLDKLPLNINGKLDRKALPKPTVDNVFKFEAPRNGLEKTMVTIWSKILNLKEEQISIKDSFFCLGGSSLSAIMLLNRINNSFSSDLKIGDIISNRTVENLARLVRSQQERN